MVKEIIIDEKIQTHDSPFGTESLILAQDLRDTMRYNWSQGRIARSISSNQIGSPLRAIAFAERLGGKIEVMFNPQIVVGRGEQEFWEDNFFRPNKMFKVRRFDEVGLNFLDEYGRKRNVHYYGEKAAFVQQEIDNLNGILPEERCLTDCAVGTKPPNPIYLEEISF